MNFRRCCANDEDVAETESCKHLPPLVSSSDDSFDDLGNTLNCDYKEVTPLFRAIELEDWKGILLFLTTGRWSTSPLASSFKHFQDPSPERQARTWITCKSRGGETQWRQLPLHAAISYMAPLPVVQKILNLHHDAIRSADDTGNLPLHLAFGFGSPDNVVALLLKEFPQALSVKGLQNRRPLDCCDLGLNTARGDVIQACQAYTRANMMKFWDKHWKKSLLDAQESAGIQEPISVKCKTLEEVFNELMQTMVELHETKQRVTTHPHMIITKTEPRPQPIVTAAIGQSLSSSSRMFSLGKMQATKGRKRRPRLEVR